MITTVTTKNMVSIPSAISRHFEISPGYKLDWQASGDAPDQIMVRVIPTRATLEKRLKGCGKAYSPDCDAVAALVRERSSEDEPITAMKKGATVFRSCLTPGKPSICAV